MAVKSLNGKRRVRGNVSLNRRRNRLKTVKRRVKKTRKQIGGADQARDIIEIR